MKDGAHDMTKYAENTKWPKTLHSLAAVRKAQHEGWERWGQENEKEDLDNSD